MKNNDKLLFELIFGGGILLAIAWEIDTKGWWILTSIVLWAGIAHCRENWE